MNTLNLPARITTKAQAIALAADLFPGQKEALAQLPAGTTHPRYALHHQDADRLRAVLFWLAEDKPTIYSRARWHLFYDLARRLIEQNSDNGFSRALDIYAEDNARKWAADRATNTMTGDGEGI